MHKVTGRELIDIELELAKACREIELLCELDLDDRDTDHLAAGIRQLIEVLGPGRATDHLAEKRPHVLAAYLVFEGLRSYSQGDFWSAVCAKTGLPGSNYTWRWGAVFRQVLVKHRLPTFDESGGNVHVTPVLLHGGIPAYCLPDFVREFVIPGVTRPEFAGLRAGDLLASWRDSARMERGDRPIRRFLQHGGRGAEDFLDRSLDLVRAVLSGQDGRPEDHGLPEKLGQVVTEVLESTTTRGLSGSRAAIGATRRLAPRLVLDAWGVGLTLHLPEQAIDGRAARWEITIDGRDPLRHAPRAWRSQGGLHLEAESIRPAAPFRHLRVQLVVDDEPCGAPWTVEGLTPEHPLLAFDEERLESLSTRRLEPRPTWFVVPRDARLEGGRPLCSPARLPGAWAELEARCLDLGGVPRLRFVHGGRTVDIPVLEESAFVRLDGPVLDSVSTAQRGVVFTGGPVKARFGGVRGRAALRLLPDSGASLVSPLTLEPEGSSSPGEHSLDLDALGLAGAFGSFVAVVRGALGHSCRVAFAIVPGLSIEFGTTGAPHAVLRCPDVLLRVEDGGWLEPARGGQRLVFTAERREAIVVASRGANSVSLRVPNPAPRWALVGMEEETEVIAWHTRALETDRERLEFAQTPAVVVEWPVDRGSEPRLVLERAGETVQVLEAARTGRVARFELVPARANLERRQGGFARLVLQPGGHEVVRVRSAWSPRNVQVEAYVEGETTRVVASWSSDDALPGRELVLFDLQRPWRSPLALSIPDADTSRCGVDLPHTALPGGPTRAWLRLRDPWAADPQPWDVPTPGSRGVCDFVAPASSASEQAGDGALACIERALASPNARAALTALGGLGRVPVDAFSRVVELLTVLIRYPSTDTVHQRVRERLQELVQADHRPFLVALARLGERMPVDALRTLARGQDLGQRIAGRHRTPFVRNPAGDKQLLEASDELTADEVAELLKKSVAPVEGERLSDGELDALGRISPALVVFLESATLCDEAAGARRRFERLLGETTVQELQPLRPRTVVAVGDQPILLASVHTDGLEVGAALHGPRLPGGLVLVGQQVPGPGEVRIELMRDGDVIAHIAEQELRAEGLRLDLQQAFPASRYACWAEAWRPAFEAVSEGSRPELAMLGGGSSSVAGGLLDADRLVVAVREALESVGRLAATERKALEVQLGNATNLLDRGLQLNVSRLPRAFAKAIRRRQRPEASRFWLMHLPFVSLAAATMQRLLARREAQDVGIRPQQLAELARALAGIAPTLQERDLCLAELALAWFRET